MGRKRFSHAVILISTVILAHCSSAKAQVPLSVDEYRCKIYHSYVEGAMHKWYSTLEAMENHYAKNKGDELLIEIIRSYYGYIPYALNKEQNDQATAMLDRAFLYLNSYRNRHPKDAEAISIHSSFLGYRMAIHPIKAVTLGVKCQQLIQQAVRLAPNNPWVLLDQANALLYTPKLFGGDPNLALRTYLKAIALLEKRGNNSCSWNYLNAYINLAYCQINIKQYTAAQQTYNKILTIAPNFKWIKQELMPKLQKKIEEARPH